jgi:hypothetical protein
MRLILVGACAVAVAGLSCSSDRARQPAGAAAAGCPANGAGELVLRPAGRIPLRSGQTVRALASVDSGTVWVLQADSAALSVYETARAGPRSIPNPEHLRTLAAGGRELLGANDTAVFALAPAGGRPGPILSLPLGVEVITSVASGGGLLWVNTSTRRSSHLGVFRRAPGGAVAPEPIARVPLDGPAVLQAAGDGAVAALVNYPFSVLSVDARGRTTARATPPGVGAADRGGSATAALLPLDCGRMLQIVSDLRSERRRFVLYQAGSDGLVPLRSRTVDAAIGFTGSLPQQRLLVGLHDVPGAREIVLFGWSWH